MKMRRVALAARRKDKADEIDTSPTDARATARAAAVTLASLGGGPVGVGKPDDDSIAPPLSMYAVLNCPTSAGVAVTPSTKGKGKRAAAAGLASSSTAKVGRWKLPPPVALKATAAAVAGSAAGATTGATVAPRPAV